MPKNKREREKKWLCQVFRTQTDITPSITKYIWWGKMTGWACVHPTDTFTYTRYHLGAEHRPQNEADEMYQASRCLMWWLNRWLTFIRIEEVKKRSRYLFENRELPLWGSSRMKCLLESLVEVLMGTFGLEFRDESQSMPTWEPWELRLCLWRTCREDERQGQNCVVSVVRKIDRSIMKNQAGGSHSSWGGPHWERVYSTALNIVGNSSEKVNKEGSLYLPTRRLLVILRK